MSKSLRHNLDVSMVPIGDLTPWSRNPRINDAASERLAYTIQEHGWTTPILAQKSSGRIIGGHTRLKAALKIGLTEVPVVYLDVDDMQADSIAIADNRLGEIAEWDGAELAKLLEEIEAEGGDLLAIGYNDADWSELIESLDESEAEPFKDDELDTSAQMGDLEFRVVVECASEEEQTKAIEMLTKGGFTCRALMS